MMPLIKEPGFSRPATVLRLLLERRSKELVLSLALRSEAGAALELVFLGVSELRFLGEATDLNRLVLLQCEDMTSQGWEEIRFRVKDYEEEFLSFYCSSIRQNPLSVD